MKNMFSEMASVYFCVADFEAYMVFILGTGGKVC